MYRYMHNIIFSTWTQQKCTMCNIDNPTMNEHLNRINQHCCTHAGGMGLPGFFEDFLTMDDTVGIPHDSADGYMTDFAVNLATLKFLQGTNSLDREKEANAIAFMQSSKTYRYCRQVARQFPCLIVSSLVITRTELRHIEW